MARTLLFVLALAALVTSGACNDATSSHEEERLGASAGLIVRLAGLEPLATDTGTSRPEGAPELTLNVEQEDALNDSDDVDWFRFTASGSEMTIRTKQAPGSLRTCDTYLVLYSSGVTTLTDPLLSETRDAAASCLFPYCRGYNDNAGSDNVFSEIACTASGCTGTYAVGLTAGETYYVRTSGADNRQVCRYVIQVF